MKIKINFKKIKKWIEVLNPPAKIGGLEITDESLKYLLLEEGRAVQQSSLRLPAGIIANGQVKDKKNLTAALTKLRGQISLKRRLNVIVSISAVNVYNQIFHLPLVAKEKLQEAARLNLVMISPIDVKSAYYDWQLVGEGENESNEGRLDVMGAFIESKIIDDLSECLNNAGFIVVAVEPLPLSLTRAIKEASKIDLSKPHIAFSLSSEGLDFFIIKNKNFYFNYFLSWESVKQRAGGKSSADLAAVKDLVANEIKRLLNFYTSRWGGVVNDLIFIGAAANKELTEHIKQTLNLNVQEAAVAPVLGAALRGAINRSDDIFISLTKVGTEAEFFQNKIYDFVKLWRNIVLTTGLLLLLSFGLFEIIAASQLSSLKRKAAEVPPGFQKEEVEQLENDAKEFNLLVEKAFLAQNQSIKWSSFFELLKKFAGSQISLTQIKLQQSNLAVSVSGAADSERSVISFKNALASQKGIKDLSLPLTAIRISPSGQATFTLTFNLEKWPL